MRILIISLSSDIGYYLAQKWRIEHDLAGTYRTFKDSLQNLNDNAVELFHCDLGDTNSITQCSKLLSAKCPWDCLIICPATMEPIDNFENCNFTEWAKSIETNFTSQMQILHYLLPFRNQDITSSVILFAGGGTNSATPKFSAYTTSKIAQIKMCELLDAEINNCKFTIIGPGWVKTKIHEETLAAKNKAEDAYKRTVDTYASEQWTPMQDIAECCEWIMKTPKNVVGGRNFSIVHDSWGTKDLESALANDPHLYTLRRHGNNLTFRPSCETI
jgi:short-subunit dehydrogenase